MRQVLLTLLCIITPILLFAQKAQKTERLHLDLKKEYDGKFWGKAEPLETKFIVNYKQEYIEFTKENGTKVEYKINRYTRATDDQTLEDVMLFFVEDPDGKRLKAIMYFREEGGIRFIENDGSIVSYFKST